MYYRIEFQHRGSPHVHLVLWLENAPIYNASDETTHQKVIDFIDSIVSTSSDDPLVADFIKYQYHKCTKTCYKFYGNKKVCRFNATFVPMDQTRILTPLPDDFVMSDELETKLLAINHHLHSLLSNDLSTIGSFENLLDVLQCTLEEYILTIRFMWIKQTKVFLQRAPENCKINPYSPKILSLMRSNMDIQFVIDPRVDPRVLVT